MTPISGRKAGQDQRDHVHGRELPCHRLVLEQLVDDPTDVHDQAGAAETRRSTTVQSSSLGQPVKSVSCHVSSPTGKVSPTRRV
ncbi:hypothetical protein O1L68_07035 [Streptomyces lydicus]|nr:hypothetical protein [Streptomyces lydicus]